MNFIFQANKNDKVIHQLTSIRQYTDISKEVKTILTKKNKLNNNYSLLQIHQFTLQTMQHPLKFSGMGLFYFGNAFLRKVYFIFTFSIILFLCFVY